MLFRHPFLAALVLLAVPTGILARKGDGSSSSSDSDSDSNSGSGGSSDSSDSSDSGDTSSSSPTSGGLSCTDSHRLDFEDLQPSHYYPYNRAPRRGHASAYSEYDGVFFKGETLFKYTITVPINESETRSSRIECPVGERTMRMLGVAWVAAKAPTPEGPRNPITVGFKAWESNIRVSDIDYSYSVCKNVDLIRFCSTVDWYNEEGANDAMDAVELDITQATRDSDKIEFDGVYDLKSWADSERSFLRPAFYENSGLWDQMIKLPEGLCSGYSNLGDVIIGWPTGTNVNGSMTNETLELTFSGSADAAKFDRSPYDFPEIYTTLNVSFEITFTGTLDAANSSQVVLTGASSNNASLITFERATNSAPVTSLSLPFLSFLSLFAFGVTFV